MGNANEDSAWCGSAKVADANEVQGNPLRASVPIPRTQPNSPWAVWREDLANREMPHRGRQELVPAAQSHPVCRDSREARVGVRQSVPHADPKPEDNSTGLIIRPQNHTGHLTAACGPCQGYLCWACHVRSATCQWIPGDSELDNHAVIAHGTGRALFVAGATTCPGQDPPPDVVPIESGHWCWSTRSRSAGESSQPGRRREGGTAADAVKEG